MWASREAPAFTSLSLTASSLTALPLTARSLID
jgi:hypothetical protein